MSFQSKTLFTPKYDVNYNKSGQYLFLTSIRVQPLT